MDASRTPQQPPMRRPAQPFEIIGMSGLGGLAPIQTPEVPQIQVQDMTQQYMTQARQSVDNTYQAVSQAIEQVGQARSAQAEAGQRSGFANALNGTIQAIQAGVQLYGTLEEQRNKRLDSQRAIVAAELRNVVSEQVIQLRRAVAQNATDVGIVPTYTQLLRNTRERYAPYLQPDVLQEVLGIGFQALEEVQIQQGQRWQSETEDLNAQLLEQRRFGLTTQIMDIVTSMTHGALSLNPGNGIPMINEKIATFLSENDIQGMDAVRLVNSVYPTIISALEAGGQNASRMVMQQQELASIMSEAQRINAEYADNAEARNGLLAPLQLRVDQLGIGIKLSDYFLTSMQRFQNQAEYIKTVQDLAEIQRGNLAGGVPTEGIEGRAMSLVIAAKAMEWVNSPVIAAAEIERASQDDAPEELRAAYRIYQDFTDSQTKVREQREIIASAQASVSQAEAQIARYAQLFDPTGTLGPPVLTDQYSRMLFEVATEQARERPQISAEYSAALQEWQRSNIFEARTRIQNAEATLQQLVTPWAQIGIDILNPANTQGLQNLISEMQPIIEQMRSTAQQQNAPLAPSNFSLGLPQLPQQ